MPDRAPLTPPQLRALRLVADGHVHRIYRSDRNAFRLIPGINANVFWGLLRRKLIKDGSSTESPLDERRRFYARTVTMILTEHGEHALMERV